MHKETIIAFNPDDVNNNVLDVISYYMGEMFVNLFYKFFHNDGHLWHFIECTKIPIEYFTVNEDQNKYKFLSFTDIIRLQKKADEKNREYLRNSTEEFRKDITIIYTRYYSYLENVHDEYNEPQLFIIETIDDRSYLLYNDSIVNFQIQCEEDLRVFNNQLSENPATENMIAAAHFINTKYSITDILVELCRSFVQVYIDYDKIPDEKKDEYYLFFVDNGKTFTDYANLVTDPIVFITGNVIREMIHLLCEGIRVSDQYTTPLFKYIRQNNIDARITYSDSISVLDTTGYAISSMLSITVSLDDMES